ncbi:MAG: Mitochondrial acidic protein mam33 [Vezdaea acicularis]|nr:MAG: Mitochondrial acidic protein mam33 [Vezdaea acicularis]
MEATTCAAGRLRLLNIESVCRVTNVSIIVDGELIAKLESEVQLEKDQNPDEKMPVSAKDYLENGPFKITDAPGSEIVTLTRQFGDEQITVTFSTDDINALEDDVDSPYPSEDDPALADEQESQSSSSNPAEATGAAEAEEDDELSGPEGTSYPARISVKVKKPGQGHLDIGTIAQDGSIVVESVLYVPEGKKSDDVDLYSPEFGNLDEDLQILLERYLDERGVNTALALFVPDYIDWKEQREYVRWLGAVKGFVEA